MVTAVTIPMAVKRLENQNVFNLKALKLIHTILFKEVYPWAGKIRTVNIAKGTAFANYELGSVPTEIVDWLSEA
jgi:fido (protein-threonine AMPylation protein)